jgi:bla regulator protein blaR1
MIACALLTLVLAQQAPPWQVAAGGKMSFEVASVKPSKPGTFFPPNFPLDPGDSFVNVRTKEPPHGRFSANFPLIVYIGFAYKTMLTREQMDAALAPLPKWVATDAFEIQARAPGDPTKDQMRLMIQTLLAERFHLELHFEAHDVPVFAMTLAKAGKMGPGLRPHAEGPPCDAPPSADVFPPICDVTRMTMGADRKRTGGSRNTTMELIAAGLPGMGNLDRPVIDRTGLTGRVDFRFQWIPDTTGPPPGAVTIARGGGGVRPPSSDPPAAADSDGPTFLQALREQLGLKLEASKGPIQMLIIDRVERPTEN